MRIVADVWIQNAFLTFSAMEGEDAADVENSLE